MINLEYLCQYKESSQLSKIFIYHLVLQGMCILPRNILAEILQSICKLPDSECYFRLYFCGWIHGAAHKLIVAKYQNQVTITTWFQSDLHHKKKRYSLAGDLKQFGFLAMFSGPPPSSNLPHQILKCTQYNIPCWFDSVPRIRKSKHSTVQNAISPKHNHF